MSATQQAVASLWNKATDDVGEAMNRNLDELNPVYMMANSGARAIVQAQSATGWPGCAASWYKPEGRDHRAPDTEILHEA